MINGVELIYLNVAIVKEIKSCSILNVIQYLVVFYYKLILYLAGTFKYIIATLLKM